MKSKVTKNFISVFAIIIVSVLALALLGAFLMGDKDLINQLIIPFITGLGTIMGAFYDRSDKTDNQNK